MSAPIQSNVYNFPLVKVVEASAGSGKTYALARWYVQLLLNSTPDLPPAALKQILAITFTNKAAFEMKARILYLIKKIALGEISKDEKVNILDPIGLTPSKAAERAYVIMDELIRNYNFFQVQTIDSFINTLISGCAFKIGLSAHFKIKRNSREYLELSLDRLIDRSAHDAAIRKVFDEFLNQYLFLENRTSWFPKKDIVILMSTLFSQNNTYGLGFKSDPSTSQSILDRKKVLLGDFRLLQESLPVKVDKRFVNGLDSFLKKSIHSFDIDTVSDYFARSEPPVHKGEEISETLEALWNKIRSELVEICQAESSSIFNCYLSIFERLKGDLKELTSRDDILFLEELNKTARLLFDEDLITVEELYFRLATRFRHYLIDEFQDTSILQWNNLMLMVEEALSSGGSLFYVGDKKQAIYRFRGGEVRLFNQIKEKFHSYNVVSEQLSKNYRSHKMVVEFNNKVFSPENLLGFLGRREDFELEKKKKNAVFLSLEEKEDSLSIFANAKQEYLPGKEDGYIQMEYIDAETKEERDRILRPKLIALIEDLRKRFELRDIAILTRGNDEIETVTSWLLSAGIFVDSERTSNIRENIIVKELISFLSFLDSPVDNLSFASFILGDLFAAASGISPAELNAFVFAYREQLKKEKDFFLYKEFRERYPEVWKELIEEFFKNVGIFPLYETVVSALKRFKCFEFFPQYQGFVMKFLQLIKDQEEEFLDLNSFLIFFAEATGEDVFVEANEANAVRVSTIHKSKGLEFPVVILPFLSMEIQPGSGSHGEKSYVVESDQEHLSLVHFKQKYFTFSDELAEKYKQEYQKSLLDELNTVYVALTRSRYELYGFMPKKVGASFNYVRFLIPDDSLIMGKKVSYPAREEKDNLVALPTPQYQDWIELLRDEFMVRYEPGKHERISQGNMVHLIFSFIGNLDQKNADDVIKEATERAVFSQPAILEIKQYQILLKQIFTKPDLRPFFFVEDGEVFQEKEIMDERGQTKRIDRLIVKKDEVWIVDFKSNKEVSGLYRTQVDEYRRIVSTLYPERKVRGFLIYLDDLQVEEVSTP